MPHHRRFLVFGLLAIFASSSFVFAQLPDPRLDAIFPASGQQGQTVEVKVRGANLDGAAKVIFSHPGITAEIKKVEQEFLPEPQLSADTFDVKIAANTPPGIYEARVVGYFGASNPRAFAVGDLPETVSDGKNRSLDAPQELAVNSAASGKIPASGRDYYQVTLKKGQRILVGCQAESLDSRADATLVIYNPQKREVAGNRDVLGADPLVDFTAAEDGDYIIGVYDFLYRGGDDYFYRLTAHDRPHVDFVFPPAGQPGSNNEYTIYGRNLPGGKPAENITVDGAPLEQVTAKIQLPQDDSKLDLGAFLPPRGLLTDGVQWQLGQSNPVRIGFAAAPVVIEKEGNNTPDQAQKLPSIPCEFAGQFFPARDTDWLEFEAKKGDIYRIEVLSHRLGLDSDPFFLLQKVVKNDKGEESVSDVANADDPSDRAGKIGSDFDTTTDDPSYRFTVPEDATYRLMVRDLFGDSRYDARYVYRLAIRKEQPDFRLVAFPSPPKPAKQNKNQVLVDTLTLRRGGVTSVEVTVDRRDGFDGEIQLEIPNLPAGVSCPGAVIGGANNKASLVLTAAENAAAWTGSLQVVGKAKVDGKDVSRVARAGSTVWGTSNRTQQVPQFRAARDLFLSVNENYTMPVTVQLGEQKVWETSLGGKLSLPLKITRRGDFKADVKLSGLYAPAEFKPKDITVKAADKEAKIELAITNTRTKIGAYTFYLNSDIKAKVVRNPQAIALAEAQQKAIDEAVKQIAEQLKKATEEKNKTVQAAKAADAELKKVKQGATDEKAVKAAEEALKKAQEAQKAAEQAEKELSDKKKRADAAKKAADKKVADTKKANAAKDLTFPIASEAIRLRIASAPFKIKDAAAVTVKQGEKAELTVALEKLYGFDEAVSITVAPPKGVGGMSAKKVSIAKGKADGKVELTAAKNAPEGEHEFTIQASGKFNNVTVQAKHTIVVKVQKAG